MPKITLLPEDINPTIDDLLVTVNNPTGSLPVTNRSTLLNVAGKGQLGWFDVRAYGAKGDGVTDDYSAIQQAITAAEAVGGIVYFPPKSPSAYAIGTRLEVNNPVTLLGCGAGSYETSGRYTPQTSLKWIGADSGTMLRMGDTTDTVANANIRGIHFDAANLAATCLEVNGIVSSTFQDVMGWNYKGVGMKLKSLTTGSARNVMFCDFDRITMHSTQVGSQGIICQDDESIALNNVCLNTFKNIKVVFNGNSPGIKVVGDNNLFLRIFSYRAAGTGYNVEINGGAAEVVYGYGWGANTIIGLTMGLNGKVHVTGKSNGNIIIGYDLSNGEIIPVIDAGSSIFGLINTTLNYLTSIIGLKGISTDYSPVYDVAKPQAVGAGVDHIDIVFGVPYPAANYAPWATPYWDTTTWISDLTVNGFIVHFGTPPGADTYIHWGVIGGN